MNMQSAIAIALLFVDLQEIFGAPLNPFTILLEVGPFEHCNNIHYPPDKQATAR